jgi:hypothetical protein
MASQCDVVAWLSLSLSLTQGENADWVLFSLAQASVFKPEFPGVRGLCHSTSFPYSTASEIVSSDCKVESLSTREFISTRADFFVIVVLFLRYHR